MRKKSHHENNQRWSCCRGKDCLSVEEGVDDGDSQDQKRQEEWIVEDMRFVSIFLMPSVGPIYLFVYVHSLYPFQVEKN